MRTCSKCGETKDEEEFSRNSAVKSGRRRDCKKCQVSRQMNYINSDPSRKKKVNQNYIKRRETLSGMVAYLLLACKSRAKKNKIAFDLDREWVITHVTPMICEATGMKLSLERAVSGWHTYNRPSIDRIDSSKGYTKDNCQVVSVIYNKAKSDGSHETVVEMCRALIEKLQGNQ